MNLCVCVCVCVCILYVLCTHVYTLHVVFFAHADFAEVSRVLVFDAEHSTNSFRVEIFDDFERESNRDH